ncbi:histone acetyltransferase 1 [Chytriomyces hyalinus]|nr:histone acetyltransferase 1 [Chytriomyces hyalinus]
MSGKGPSLYKTSAPPTPPEIPNHHKPHSTGNINKLARSLCMGLQRQQGNRTEAWQVTDKEKQKPANALNQPLLSFLFFLVRSSDSRLNRVNVAEDASDSIADEGRRTFGPQFTYPLFGEEETLFGYKHPVVRLHYSAGSLYSFLGMSYTYKIDNDPDAIAKAKRIGGVAPKADDVLAIVRNKLPEKGYTDDYNTFMEHVRRDEQGGFKPVGEKLFEYSLKHEQPGTVYEVYKANFSTPRFKAYNAALQVLLLFFIEGASAIDEEDEAWEAYLVFERREIVSGAGSVGATGYAWSLVGFSTIYTFWCWPDSKRLRISQVLILPPYQGKGHGKELYNALKRDFILRKEVIDFGVEDPNDEFQNLRDVCDVKDLLHAVNVARKSLSPPLSQSMLPSAVLPSQIGQADGATRQALDQVIAQVKDGAYKLSKGQRTRCIEMLQLHFLDRKSKSDATAFRLSVKKRLFKHNEEVLSGMEASEMKAKLQETYENVEQGYRDILRRTVLHNENQKVSAPANKKEKKERVPSAYNMFMKTELSRVKSEDPKLTHKEAFKIAAGNWKDSDVNPSNKK